jgi:NtrC-family two-component system sensor histidine kinase KinB
LITEHKQALDNISATERSSRERALLIAGLLGLVGLAVLIIGFVTAHAIARRFGEPIEALARRRTRSAKANSTSRCRFPRRWK